MSSSSSTTATSSVLERRLRKERGAETRVLSIQSHVVHGYAGNKCSVFPLQVIVVLRCADSARIEILSAVLFQIS